MVASGGASVSECMLLTLCGASVSESMRRHGGICAAVNRKYTRLLSNNDKLPNDHPSGKPGQNQIKLTTPNEATHA